MLEVNCENMGVNDTISFIKGARYTWLMFRHFVCLC